ncbi:TPA: hypothetical protein N0F65_002311 [Lagenidium giganteum]|uniref:Uncharacterized protein n=1 Tax=Lagenidium giganteum TaxID=4803 RepID=A0AAV2Z974_9STRA|nr:TPA: hypothetical protein N0F65_002310 [Lagenidium giganteum]DBA01176.1 TPA: hypothetical protein N0F65_002311 [Lagenidium giganteum]
MNAAASASKGALSTSSPAHGYIPPTTSSSTAPSNLQVPTKMLSTMTMQPKPLATLSAVDDVPQRFTERTRVLSFLKRIDTVHIHEH